MEEYILYGMLGLKIILDIPFLRKRIITDTNMLNVFSVAKKSIADSNNIKINVKESLTTIDKKVQDIDKLVDDQIKQFNDTILEFQESELYQKMLLGLAELDELHKTLQNKDATIDLLGNELKATRLALQEINNKLKG